MKCGIEHYPCTRTVDKPILRLRKKLSNGEPGSPSRSKPLHNCVIAPVYKFLPYLSIIQFCTRENRRDAHSSHPYEYHGTKRLEDSISRLHLVAICPYWGYATWGARGNFSQCSPPDRLELQRSLPSGLKKPPGRSWPDLVHGNGRYRGVLRYTGLERDTLNS